MAASAYTPDTSALCAHRRDCPRPLIAPQDDSLIRRSVAECMIQPPGYGGTSWSSQQWSDQRLTLSASIRLFHRTRRANSCEILREGFWDGRDSYGLQVVALEGVLRCLSVHFGRTNGHGLIGIDRPDRADLGAIELGVDEAVAANRDQVTQVRARLSHRLDDAKRRTVSEALAEILAPSSAHKSK